MSRGFSLIEVVLALGIFSFCLVVLIGLIPVGLTTEKDGSDELNAIHLAQRLFDQQRASTNPLSVSDQNLWFTRELVPLPSRNSKTYFQVTSHVRPRSLPDTTNLFEMDLEMQWPLHHETFSSLIRASP